MLLTYWLNQTVIVARMATVSGDKTAYTTHTSCLAHIQPLGAEKTALIDGVFGKAFRIWVDADIDIVEGDRLRSTSDGKHYKVKKGGVNTRSFGSIEYREITIEETI